MERQLIKKLLVLYHTQLSHTVLQVQQSLKNTFVKKKGQQKVSEDTVDTVGDSQDASHTENNKDVSSTTDVTNGSPLGSNGNDDTNLSSKEKLAKFSFEHKAQ